MRDVLLFTLYAPLASWGDIAVGESRGSWDRPSRSAVLGIVAAALGIDRAAQDEHDALNAGYGVAVRLDAPGSSLVDYHTAQTASAHVVRRRRPGMRAELLELPKTEMETILSRRTYRQNALVTAALWVRAEWVPWTLGEIAEMLKRPRYVLYAGRKANAFGLPLAPRIGAAETLATAFAQRAAEDEGPRVALGLTRVRPRGGWGREVAHDPCDVEGFEAGFVPVRREIRRDAGAHRTRWQFADRVVDVGHLPDPALDVAPVGGRSS